MKNSDATSKNSKVRTPKNAEGKTPKNAEVRTAQSSEVKTAKIGIMGGTFDPVHLGHIGVAEAALEEAGLDEVWMMPAFIQPFKQDRYVADARDRIKMLELAFIHEDRIKVSTWEIERECVSYTYDTITNALEENSIDKIYFLLGSDSLMKIETWHKGKELLGICNFIVGLRPTNDRTQVEEYAEFLTKEYGTEIILLEKTMLPISSTMIRNLVEERKPIAGLVSPLVEEYIYAQELYI